MAKGKKAKLVSIPQAAKLLDVPEISIRKAVDAHKIPKQLLNGRFIVLELPDVEEWVKNEYKKTNRGRPRKSS